MDNLKGKNETISIRVNSGQKNQLKRFADLSNKSLSDYVRDMLLSSIFNTTEKNFYQSIYQGIDGDLIHLKQSQYATNKLLLAILREQIKPQTKSPEEAHEKAMQFYSKLVKEAQEKF